MATAKAGPRRSARMFTLKLTEGEVDTLIGVLSQVGGHPTKSPRKYVRRILTALKTASGYSAADTDTLHLSLGHIEMFNYDDHPVITTGDRAAAALTSAGFQLHAEYENSQDITEAIVTMLALAAQEDELSDVPS